MGNVGSSLLATRRERSESEHGREGGEERRLKAGKRTKDESGCRWRGRKESHEMPGRFVGSAGEPRGRDAVDAGGRGTRWTKRGWRKGGRRREKEEEEGEIGVVVCAGTEKGDRAGVGWNTPEDRKRGEGSREGEG